MNADMIPPYMPPVLATLATAADVRGDGWVFEAKWDGVRAIVRVGDDDVRVMSRNARDITGSFPEVTELAGLAGGHTLVLDGEIVALDDSGRSDFGLLQQRLGVVDPRRVEVLRRQVPAFYVVFDLLYVDGRDLTGQALSVRRRGLEALRLRGRHVTVPDRLTGSLSDAVDLSRQNGWEGILAKRADSLYARGRRSRDWLKIKNHQDLEAVIIGWQPGAGNRAGRIGSLLLAKPAADGFRYIGKVGTGFDDRELERVRDALSPLAANDPVATDVPAVEARHAHWVRPELVCEVQVGEVTRSGRIRHPSWRGLRHDKAPRDIN